MTRSFFFEHFNGILKKIIVKIFFDPQETMQIKEIFVVACVGLSNTKTVKIIMLVEPFNHHEGIVLAGLHMIHVRGNTFRSFKVLFSIACLFIEK